MKKLTKQKLYYWAYWAAVLGFVVAAFITDRIQLSVDMVVVLALTAFGAWSLSKGLE